MDPTILIAEDNSDDFLLIQRAFRKSAIEVPVHWARDGWEAKDYLLGVGPFADRLTYPLPGLILADLKMPRMNGLELLTWLRSEKTVRRIPFIMLTSSSQVLDVNEAYHSGVNSYLVKPTAFEELIELSRLLKNYWLMANQRPELLIAGSPEQTPRIVLH